MALERFELELVSFEDISQNTRHFTFKRTDKKKLNFIAGQFITLLLTNAEGELKRRSYSIASIPSKNDFIEIGISFVKGGIASETTFGMQIGDKIKAMGPAGRLTLKDEEFTRIFLVGTGTGIVPYRAMSEEIANNFSDKNINIILGARTREDAIYSQYFINLDNENKHVNFTLCLSREENLIASFEQKGYVQQQFDNFKINPKTDVIYLCGNPHMIDDAYENLLKKGFEQKNVRREKYISPK